MAGVEKLVLTETEGGVRTIRLNRPEVLNAFNDAMLAELAEAVRDAEEDSSVRCLVITGAGRAFSAGLDLVALAERYKSDAQVDLGRLLRERFHPIVVSLRTMEKPVIAAVNGVAAGAGAAIALVCDLRVAGESASFIQAFVHVGLVPDCGSTFMLPRLVGVARALELTCTGRKVDASEAVRIGMVNQVVADHRLTAATRELAKRFEDLPARAIGMTKRAINAAWTSDLTTQLELEAGLQSEAARTADHREGLEAFLKKRAPSFTGH